MTADLSKIKLLLLDVDGVMTDGRIIYGSDEKTLQPVSIYMECIRIIMLVLTP